MTGIDALRQTESRSDSSGVRAWAALGVRIEGDQDAAIALLRSLAA